MSERLVITKEMLENTVIGQGVTVARTWSTKADNTANAMTVNGEIDFSGCNLEVVLKWATSERVIARHRVERTMKDVPKKVTVMAALAGAKKAKSLEDTVAEMSDAEYADYITRLENARKKVA